MRFFLGGCDMRHSVLTYTLLCVLSFCAPIGQALASDLYQATVIVTADDESPNRTEIVQKALRQVLIKVAGNREIVSDPAVSQQLKDAENMVSSFQFAETANDAENRELQIRFDPAQIQDVLLKAEQEFWTGKRPTIMVWLVDLDAKADPIVASDTNTTLAHRLAQISTERGIALTLPLMDLEDISKINATEIRQLDLEAINNASMRYGAPVQLVGKIKKKTSDEKTETQIDWYLVQDFSRRHFTTTGENLVVAVNQGLEDGIDTIARRHARVASDKGQAVSLVLTVYDVKDINHYADLMRYLKALPVTHSIDVKRIGRRDVTFNLSIAGGRGALVKVLADDHILRPVQEGGALDAQNLRYQMQA